MTFSLLSPYALSVHLRPTPSCSPSSETSVSRSSSDWTFPPRSPSPRSVESMPLPSRSPSPATHFPGLVPRPPPSPSFASRPPPPSPFSFSPGAFFGGDRIPPSDTMSSPVGSLSRGRTPSMAGSATATPEKEYLSPANGPVSGRSCLGAYDPAINPGHVLPVLPPLMHELDRTWGELHARLEAVASACPCATGFGAVVPELGESRARGYTHVELEWIAGSVRQRRFADSAQFWAAAAERFNNRFQAEKSGKALRKQFLRSARVGRARGGRRARDGRRGRRGGVEVVAGGAPPVEGWSWKIKGVEIPEWDGSPAAKSCT